MQWSEPDDKRLSILWAQGLSAKKIGIAMGDRSKNAIIGRAHRLELPPRRVPLAPGEVRPATPRCSRSRCSNFAGIEAVTRDVIRSAEPPAPPTNNGPWKGKIKHMPLPPAAGTTVTKRATTNGSGLTVRNIKWAAPVQPENLLDPNEIPQAQRKQIFDLTQTDCRFPYGDVGEESFFFCGAEALKGHSYCPLHCRVAFAGSGTKSVYAFGRRG